MFARTKRLTLRPGWPEDAPALSRAIAHESVVTKLSHAPWPYALGDAEAFLAFPRAASEPRFLIETHDGDRPRLIGGIAIDRDAPVAELGYWLTPDAWGRGYATEAGEAVVAMARHALGLRRLIAAPFADNPGAARVLAKLGFRPTGRFEARPARARGGETLSAIHALDLESERCDPMPMAA